MMPTNSKWNSNGSATTISNLITAITLVSTGLFHICWAENNPVDATEVGVIGLEIIRTDSTDFHLLEGRGLDHELMLEPETVL